MRLQHANVRTRILPKPLVACIVLVLSGGIIDASPAIAVDTDHAGAPILMPVTQLWQPQSSPLHQLRLHMAAQRVASAAHVPVTRTVMDCADDNGAGTLRPLVAAAASGDSIDLSALQCSTITLTQGEIQINVDDLNIIGPGVNNLTVDGNNQDRVFAHFGYGTLSLSDMTVTNGSKIVSGTDVGAGGCIASAAYLALTDLVVSHCNAAGEGAYGGAVFGYGLSMSNSTISDSVALGTHPANFTAAFGGAAFVYTMDLTNSTISGNSAQRHLKPGNGGYEIGGAIVTIHGGTITGSTIDSNYSYRLAGAIASFADTLTLTNSTISGNRAQNSVGGGLHVRVLADLMLYNDTITNNFAQYGGGIFLSLGQQNVTAISSLVSGNSSAANIGADLYSNGALTLDGTHNLIGSVTPTVVLPPGTLRTAAHLQPLAANGGATRTHALSAGSPAIDAGTNGLGLPDDQRGPGFARVFGAAADIGAFEAQEKLIAPPPTPVPAASTWGLVLLTGLFGFSGWRKRRAFIAVQSARVS